MYGQGQPYFRPYPPPPPPPKPPLSPLAIAAIVIGGLVVLGIGATVLLGALVLAGAGAEADAPAASASSLTTAAPPAVASTVEPPDEPPAATATPTATAAAPTTTNAAPTTGATWFCNASGSARVCGFAGACNYQMMFGNGFGKDRFLASQQAKNACEAQARAKGTSTVCVVQCTLR